MNFLVAVQGLLVAEVLPTRGTLVGRLARVDTPVLEEMIPPDEALPTLRALVGPLACVDPLVPDSFGEVAEIFAAVCASQRPVAFPCVQLLVEEQAHLQLEALLALGASVWPLHHVVPGAFPSAGLETGAPLGLGAFGRLRPRRSLNSRRSKRFGLWLKSSSWIQTGVSASPAVALLVSGEKLFVQEALPTLTANVRACVHFHGRD